MPCCRSTTDYVWQQIEEHGEATIRQRIAAIDSESLNAGLIHPLLPAVA